MTMNLVLQGPGASLALLRRIGTLARAGNMIELNAHALRCEQVDDSAATRQAVELAAIEARVDATFIEIGRAHV